jgi:hypothetical protein
MQRPHAERVVTADDGSRPSVVDRHGGESARVLSVVDGDVVAADYYNDAAR